MATAPANTSTLAALAKKINSLNTGVVEQMVLSGKLLIEAKTRLKQESGGKRGGFQDWVRQNLKITPQTATRYMRLAKSRNPLKAYGAQTTKRIKKVRTKDDVTGTNWGTLAPINRAKAAFNALEPTDRQEFLKWVTEQLDREETKPVAKQTRATTRQIPATQQATV